MKHNKDFRRLIPLLLLLFFIPIFGCKPPRYRGFISGRITDRDGNPIAGAKVVIIDLNAEDDFNNTSSYSGRNGEFYIPIHCDRAGFSVYAESYTSISCSRKIVTGANKGWDFKLIKLVPVSGRVMDTKGNPAANRILNFMPLEEELSDGSKIRYHMNCTRVEQCTDANGIFHIPGAAPLKCKISVSHADGHLLQRPVNAEIFDLTTAANQTDLEIIINPPKDYSISGHIHDDQGNPVPRAVVKTYTIPQGLTWWSITDNNGAFCLEGLDGFGKDTFDIHFNGATRSSEAFNFTKTDIPMHTKDLVIIVPL